MRCLTALWAAQHSALTRAEDLNTAGFLVSAVMKRSSGGSAQATPGQAHDWDQLSRLDAILRSTA